MFVQLVRRFLNNTFPSDSFALSTNEIMLHIDQSIADKIPKLAYQNAQFEGVLAVAEAFLVTFSIVGLVQDPITLFWSAKLPQPPLSLPLGYSINDAYFTGPSFGKSVSIYLVKAKYVSYRDELPMPPGPLGWVEGSTFWIKTVGGFSLNGMTLKVQMPTARTTDLDAPFNMPDDILWICYNEVITRLMERFKVPRDNIKDNEPAGNNKVKEGN